MGPQLASPPRDLKVPQLSAPLSREMINQDTDILEQPEAIGGITTVALMQMHTLLGNIMQPERVKQWFKWLAHSTCWLTQTAFAQK